MVNKFSFANLTAGFVAVMVGFTSSVVIIFQAAAAVGANSAEVGSWLLALGLGMGITSIGLSLFYRMPILIAWSTPGAALLVTSLAGVSMPEAIGAFIFSALLILIAGLTGWFEKLMTYIPRSLTSAMLAGILLQFGMNLFVAMQQQFVLVTVMLIGYLFGRQLFPRYVIILSLTLGIAIAVYEGLFDLTHCHFALSIPQWVFPVFSWPVLVSIGIPLFVVTMTSQNMPGVAVLRTAGYNPPISPLISWTGLTTLVLAPFGGYAFNLAAITAAICMGEEADVNPAKRYRATVWAGIFYVVTGILGASVVALFAAFPKALVLAIAGLALLNTIGSSLKLAIEDEAHREPALITFLVSASGMSLLGIGSAFWGLVAGALGFVINSTILSAKRELVET
ncbi:MULTISPECIES: benzoate/H(+) symporter BenE family transporter [Legionella]|uniref:Inner membrane protein YdcO n=1 Tax=Legionella maceachernii TaxID=466 RepID=A0A0W0WGV1_9GAMM|nr:benzoate/H(+) symporter BenE family transporter [Legionella maceachernii]KTD31565.1 Inner membrane protein YdcO [Legionella maceachernii]SKA11525.1 benzoate membrane transport protein [Legionella maceachernii]SUO99612.1 Inner membrane protein ydcO [Legionella maceachernii]